MDVKKCISVPVSVSEDFPGYICDSDGLIIAKSCGHTQDNRDEIARIIVACVNAFYAMPKESPEVQS